MSSKPALRDSGKELTYIIKAKILERAVTSEALERNEISPVINFSISPSEAVTPGNLIPDVFVNSPFLLLGLRHYKFLRMHQSIMLIMFRGAREKLI